MKIKWMAVLGMGLLATRVFAGEPLVLKNQTEKDNYSTGVNIVRNLKQQGGAVNLDIVIKGMKDELTGGKLLLTEEDLRKSLAALEMTRQQKQALIKRDDIKADAADNMTEPANAAPLDDAGVLQRSRSPRQQRIEQDEQAGLLASREPAGTRATTGNAAIDDPAGTQTQDSTEQRIAQGGQQSPNGALLSRRNQARLSIQQLKAEMRARASAETMQ